MNEHIATARDGEDVTIKIIGLQGLTAPSSGLSGHVPVGTYVFRTKKASLVKKSGDKTGFNVKFEDVVVLPEQFAGVPIVTYTPVPAGEPGDKTFDAGMRGLRDRMIASAQYAGVVDKVNNAPEKEIKISSYEGKMFAATTKDGTGQYSDRSEIANYVTKEDFAKNPGPTVGFGPPAASKPQSTVPEVAAGAVATGAQTSAPAAPAAPATPAAAAVSNALGWT